MDVAQVSLSDAIIKTGGYNLAYKGPGSSVMAKKY